MWYNSVLEVTVKIARSFLTRKKVWIFENEILILKILPEDDSKIEMKLEILLNYSFWRYMLLDVWLNWLCDPKVIVGL